MVVSKGVDRFSEATRDLGLTIIVQPESTHTAQEAADAVGAPVGAIVKSLVFRLGGEPLLVLASGPNRVNTDALADALGGLLSKADADYVKQVTGYSIGGVPPFGHPTPLRTVMDEDLLAFDQVWAAAGSQTAVFAISPHRIREISGADVMAVT